MCSCFMLGGLLALISLDNEKKNTKLLADLLIQQYQIVIFSSIRPYSNFYQILRLCLMLLTRFYLDP